MATKSDLVDWVYDALKSSGGEASVVEVAKHIWSNHESELRQSGDLFFTWQYDMRWAAQHLRDTGKCIPASTAKRGFWALRQ
jgi:hypothetical protein